jgi:hypothetical protein
MFINTAINTDLIFFVTSVYETKIITVYVSASLPHCVRNPLSIWNTNQNKTRVINLAYIFLFRD